MQLKGTGSNGGGTLNGRNEGDGWPCLRQTAVKRGTGGGEGGGEGVGGIKSKGWQNNLQPEKGKNLKEGSMKFHERKRPLSRY